MELVKRYDCFGDKRYILKLKKPSMKLKMKYRTFMNLQNTYNNLEYFYKNYFFLILTFLWMSVIFYFSHQPANISSNTSKNVSLLFSNIAFFRELFKIFSIRKIAHFFLYFCLSFLVYKTFFNWEYFEKLNTIYLVSIFVSFIYACTDEIHQIFVIGRGPHFIDVIIDTSGAALCMLIVFIIDRIIINFLKKRHYFE